MIHMHIKIGAELVTYRHTSKVLNKMKSAGAAFRALVTRSDHGKAKPPLAILGAANAYAGKMAERYGAKALYVSGSGVASVSFGMPDLAIHGLNEVCEDVRRLAGATTAPILVDADTGFGAGSVLNLYV
jgi:methylisocitrate lyase